MQDRLIGGSEKPEDHIDRAIRPTSLDDYIGQPVVREQMEIFIGAARGRGEACFNVAPLSVPFVQSLVEADNAGAPLLF